MLILLAFILLITVLFLAVRKEHKSPLFVFSSIWLLLIGLYSLKLFGMYDISFTTEIVLFCGVCFFICGYLIQNFFVVKYGIECGASVQISRLSLLSVVLVAISLPYYATLITQVLMSGDLSAGKMGLVTGEIASGGIVFQYIVRPFEYIVVAMSAYYLLFDKKKKTIILSGLAFCLFEFIGAGAKIMLTYYVLCLLVAYLFNPKYVINSKALLRIKRGVYVVFGAVAVVLLYIVGIKDVYFYACGCIPMLDKIVNDSFYITDGYTHGFLSFNSLARFFIKGAGVFGIEINSELFERANTYFVRFENTTQIADGIQYNAYHTLFGDFYCDFGLFGVCALSFLFGMFSCWCYKQHKQSNCLWSHTLYCILMYYIVFSMVRFHMSNTYLGLMLIYTIMFLKQLIYARSRTRKVDICLRR